MFALISLFVILIVSMLIVRVAASALTLTGLSRQAAQFQARSAFTGVGFTTSESEKVLNHPVRRRIVMALMLAGNLGISGVVASLILAFVNVQGMSDWGPRLLILFVGLVLLWIVSYSSWFNRRLSRWIGWILRRWSDLDARDYASLLRVSGDYTVAELKVLETDPFVGKSLAELALGADGVLVLGIVRSDGAYVGGPRGETRVSAKDTLILYGQAPIIEHLNQRKETVS